MAILIVDDEASTRRALRELLTHLGHKTILEASNGEEAIKAVEAGPSRIRLIIADLEMPYMDGAQLLESIQELPEVDLAPFVLITSDVPRARLQGIQARSRRLDAFLEKPFRLQALNEAIRRAQARRASTHSTVIIYRSSVALEALENENPGASPRRKIVFVSTVAELERQTSLLARELEVLILRPDAKIAEWLAAFSKTRLGTVTPVICAGREPQEIFPIRTLCQAFLPPDADAPTWVAALESFRARRASAIEIEVLFRRLKAAQQRRDTGQAQRMAEQVLELVPSHPEAHAALGDVQAGHGGALNEQAAIAHYLRALEVNPCQPRPYIRLLELAHALPPGMTHRISSEASRFCPENQDVLCSVARTLRSYGEHARAAQIAERLFQINPGHALAKDWTSP